jgi:hypothetical protein
MKISHEVPISLFEYNYGWSDYDYCLPVFMDKYPNYRQYFLDSRERGRFIIMDNSLFEGYSHTTQDLLDKINLIQPDIFIVPDDWNNKAITAKNAKHWKQYDLPENTNLMVVMQGTTLSEMHQLYQQCVDMGYTHFAFNHSSILYHELCPTENLVANQAVGRVLLLENMKQEKLIKPHHYIHLLGCSVPQEFTHYRDNWEPGIIDSVDTSNPVICGALGIRYNEIGLLEKPVNKIEEFMESDLEDKLEDIKYNIQRFRNLCNK